MRIGVAGRVEEVPKPWAPGNAVRIEPVGFHLKQLRIELANLRSARVSRGELAERQVAQVLARFLEGADFVLQG